MKNWSVIYILLLIVFTIFVVSCGSGHQAARSPSASDQQLDFETLGDDWGDSQESVKDQNKLELEDEVIIITV